MPVVLPVEEAVQPVTETPVERAVKPAAQVTPQQFAGLVTAESATATMTTTSRLESTTVTTDTRAGAVMMHGPVLAPSLVPVEPMTATIPGAASPYHAVDFCVPVGPDFSLVSGLFHTRRRLLSAIYGVVILSNVHQETFRIRGGQLAPGQLVHSTMIVLDHNLIEFRLL